MLECPFHFCVPIRSVVRCLSFLLLTPASSGLARFLRIGEYAGRWRWFCGPIVGVTPFAVYNFALEHVKLVVDNPFPAFDDISFLAYTGIRIVGKCERFPIDRYCTGNSGLVDCQSMLLNANNAIWPITLGSNFSNVGLSVAFEFFVPTTSSTLSTNTSSFIVKTGVLRPHLSESYF